MRSILRFDVIRKFSLGALVNAFTAGVALTCLIVYANFGGSPFSTVLATAVFIISITVVLIEVLYKRGE